MRIRQPPRKSNILDIPPNFARIAAVRRDEDGTPTTFAYELTFNVDQVAAVREDVAELDVLIRKRERSEKPSAWQPVRASQVVRPADVSMGLKTVASRRKDVSLSNTTAPVNVSRVAHPVSLEPARAKVIRAAPDEDAAEVALPQRRVVTSMTVRDVRAANRKKPVLKVATNSPNTLSSIRVASQSNDVEVNSIQAASLDLVMKKAVDPSDVLDANLKVLTTEAALAGVGAKPTPVQLSAAKVVNVTPKMVAPIVALTGRPVSPASDNAIIEEVEIPVIQNVRVRSAEVTHTVIIDAEDLQELSTFYVEFRLLTGTGMSVGSVKRTVEHARLLTFFNTPAAAPRVAAAPAQLPGRNIIELEQVDDEATSIRMYRRRVGRLTNVNDAGEMLYVDAGEVPIVRSDGRLKVVDLINNASTTMYRFIAVGPRGELGQTFSNLVVPGTGLLPHRRRRVVAAAIDVVPQGNDAVVRVTNIVGGPVAVGIQRRNMTIFEDDYSFIADRPIALTAGDGDIRFLDQNVKADNIYEYRALLYLEDGSEVLSSGYTVYEHDDQDDRGISIVVSDPQVRNSSSSRTNLGVGFDRSQYDVTFTVASEFEQADEDRLFDALEKRGLSSMYRDELLQDRDKLQKLVAHRIQRVDTSTGRVEDMGVLTDTVFSDTSVSRRRPIRPLTSGVTYRYVITTLLRSPETLFEDFEKVSTTSTRLSATTIAANKPTSREFAFRPAKFLHPLTLKTGTLTSKTTRASQHARDEFEYGAVGNTRVIEVTIPSDDVRVGEPTVERVDRITNAVRWSTSGDISRVDYFIVVFTHLGTDQVVGRVHAFGGGSTFEFMHGLEDVDVGTGTYTVKAMLTSFKPGSSATSERVVI